MKKSDLFNLLFANRGQYIDLENQDEDTLLLMLRFILADMEACLSYKSERLTEKPKIVIGFLRNPLFGACVREHEGSYYVAVYEGSIILLQTLFTRILTSPNVLPEYGNCAEEVAQPLYNPYITDVRTLFLVTDHAPIPVSEERNKLAFFLVRLAMRYVILHEYTHVIHGHVDYLRNITSNVHWEELLLNHTGNNLIDPIHSQVLEYDADITAHQASLSYLFAIANNETGTVEMDAEYYRGENHEVKFIPHQCEEVIILHIFACSALFNLFGTIDSNKEALSRLTHSPASIRMLQFHSGMAGRLSEIFAPAPTRAEQVFHELAIKLVASAYADVVRGFQDIGESEEVKDNARVAALFALGQQEHLGMLQYKWNEVRPLISPHSIVELSPLWEASNS